jgi:hypothetical protein
VTGSREHDAEPERHDRLALIRMTLPVDEPPVSLYLLIHIEAVATRLFERIHLSQSKLRTRRYGYEGCDARARQTPAAHLLSNGPPVSESTRPSLAKWHGASLTIQELRNLKSQSVISKRRLDKAISCLRLCLDSLTPYGSAVYAARAHIH